MGMYDHVNFEADCYACGCKLTGWQSKSGPCDLLTLKPWQVDNLYTHCPKCGRWNEYTVEADVEHIVHNINFERVTQRDESDKEVVDD